jgi:hypothetical protein
MKRTILKGPVWQEFIQQQQEVSIGFNDSASFSPVPAPLAWVGTYVLTGTLANSATTCTAITNPPGTLGLFVGQTVSGTGITPGTTIAAIVSATAITLSLNTTASAVGAQTLTFAPGSPAQSAFAYQAGLFPFRNPLSVPVVGSMFDVPDVQILAATGGQGAIYVPAPGVGLVTIASGTTAAAVIQFNINPTPTWTTVYTGTISATVSTWIETDGTSVRWNNLAATASTFTFYRMLRAMG